MPEQTPADRERAKRDAGRRRLAWIVPACVVLLVFLAYALFNLLRAEPGFTLVVRGAPRGGEVYVDRVRRGVPVADGSIRVAGLREGRREVRVTGEGVADFNTFVSGSDGEVQTVTAHARAGALPREIDYGGTMLLVAAGEFVMGDDAHAADERPAHKVSLPDFYIDKFEVTNQQYRKFCDETKRPFPEAPWWDAQYFNSHPNSPVVGVNWDDAASYAKWAGKRLPTEAEWEKAASWGAAAQSKRTWPWGNKWEPGAANLGAKSPAPVGQRTAGASAYGVEDMAGNVLEWVDAAYQPYAGNNARGLGFDPALRVARGGHFKSGAADARTSRRFHVLPNFSPAEQRTRSWLIGFRCAVSADDPALQERLAARQQ